MGFTGCVSGGYQRKHNLWVNFTNLPAGVNRPFRAFPYDYRKLPTVSLESPNMCHSMHDCSIRTGGRWMKKHLDRYARWATHHNSWLVVTFGENAGGTVNPIPTIIIGDHVRPGPHAGKIDRYVLRRTIEDAYGLPTLGCAAAAYPTVADLDELTRQPRTRPGFINGCQQLLDSSDVADFEPTPMIALNFSTSLLVTMPLRATHVHPLAPKVYVDRRRVGQAVGAGSL